MINKAIIIDDNEEICAMLETEIGRNFNFKTRSFLSAEAFFEASDRDQSLFLVDMNLPGKDGAEIIRQIRRYDKLSRVHDLRGSNSGDHPDRTGRWRRRLP